MPHISGEVWTPLFILCRCDALWLVEKASLTRKRGSVAPIRRRQIVDKINACMGWKLV